MAVRKRNRISVVCTFCKKRKVRCDKGQPCSTCIKYGNDECIYECLGISDELKKQRDHDIIKNEIRLLNNKIRKLQEEMQEESPTDQLHHDNHNFPVDKNYPFYELLGNNPVADHDDKLNFYNCNVSSTSLKRSTLRRSHAPFNWISLMKSDTILNNLLDYLLYLAVHERTNKSILDKDLNRVETEFENKLENIDGTSDIKLYKDSLNNAKHQRTIYNLNNNIINNNNNNNVNNHVDSTVVLGYNKSDLSQVEILTEKIRLSLPTKGIIWRLIGIFFKKYYFLSPVFDQKEFFENTIKLIGKLTYDFDPIESIHVEKRIDFAHLGSLLLVLRITYLYITSSTTFESRNKLLLSNDFDIKVILDNPIPANFYNLSRQCLGMFDLLSTASIPVFQFALFVRIYIMYAPEEGDGDRENEILIFNNILLNMAISLGLNRDPDFLFGKNLDPRAKNLSRKLWWTVYSLNIHQSFVNGNRLTVKLEDFDTKLYFYEEGNNNIENIDMEIQSAELSRIKTKINASFLEMSELVSTVRDEVDMKLISQSLEYMELSILKGYGRIRDKFKDVNGFPSEMDKLIRSRLHIFTSIASIAVMFNFYGYYERKDNFKLMAYYVKKLTVLIGYDLIPFCYEIVHNSGVHFKDVPVLPIIPDLLQSLHKSILVFLSFFVRCKKDISKFSDLEDHNEKLTTDEPYVDYFTTLIKTAQSFSKIIKELIATLTDFSPSYFYAWRLTKAMKTMYELASGTDLYTCYNLKNARGFQFSSQHLKDIHNILTQTVKRIEDLKAETKAANDGNHGPLDQRGSSLLLNNSINKPVSNGSPINSASTSSSSNSYHLSNEKQNNKNSSTFNYVLPNIAAPVGPADADKIWTNVMASKSDPQAQKIFDSGYLNIANYSNVGFDDSSSVSESMPEMFGGTGLDDILRSFLEKA